MASKEISSNQGRPLATLLPLDLQTPGAAGTLYPTAERARIVEQLRLVLEQFYVHWELKKSEFGYDPLRALSRFEAGMDSFTAEQFHDGIARLVARTKDRHLAFWGKRLTPHGTFAVLPFCIERCFIDGNETFVVTKVRPGFKPQRLVSGAFVTHWNGVPIERHVALNAELFDGGNDASARARGVEFLANRPLRQFGAPAEMWVELSFNFAGKQLEERFHWETIERSEDFADCAGAGSAGCDNILLESRLLSRVQFAPHSFDPPPAPGKEVAGQPFILGAKGNFSYGRVTTPTGTFAYVRLYNFQAEGDAIAKDMAEVLRNPALPREGLIIDIRGNPGGQISAGEKLLQLLAPTEIVPTRFQFRNTAGVRQMVQSTTDFTSWRQSLLDGAAIGELFSQGYPISDEDDYANRLGQKYFGPVVVITDALAYSTADMFAVGFVDNGIGTVIGTDVNIAAAGGNSWSFEELLEFNPDFQMEAKFAGELKRQTISKELRQEFQKRGRDLSAEAVAGQLWTSHDERINRWEICDGGATHQVRQYLKYPADPLNVLLDHGRSGLAVLPPDVDLRLTARRCIRSGLNQGRVLEDLGILPAGDSYSFHHMTLKDVLGKNEDLLAAAGKALAGRPVYDLAVNVVKRDGQNWEIDCGTRGISRLEAYRNGLYLAHGDVSVTGRLHFPVSGEGPAGVLIIGFCGNKQVARAWAVL